MEMSGRTLVIETATEACSIALFEGDELLSHDHRVLGRGHAERLIPMIEAMPKKGEAEQILVSLGPGSFTGVRIGIAAARALAIAWRATIRGYPTLALVAQMALARRAEPVTVCMNGGHGEWFVEDFGSDGISTLELASPEPAQAQERGTPAYIAGNRAKELSEPKASIVNVFETTPDARYANLLSPDHLSSKLSPIYGRAPDAIPQKLQSAKA